MEKQLPGFMKGLHVSAAKVGDLGWSRGRAAGSNGGIYPGGVTPCPHHCHH